MYIFTVYDHIFGDFPARNNVCTRYTWFNPSHKKLERRTKAMLRVGQNRIYAPYMTVYLVISLPKIPYIHRIYMVLANPSNALLIHFCLASLSLSFFGSFFKLKNPTHSHSGLQVHQHTIPAPTLPPALYTTHYPNYPL